MVRLPAPGNRVVVRYLLPTGQATDALGELLSADGEVVVVEDRLGVTMTEIIKTEDSGA